MSKQLVIVESPAKAKTISRILPKYTIKASMGHIRDLPEKIFGVDVEHDFTPTYEETQTRKKNLSDLKKAAREASDIYLASDPDREGEAIAWHLREVLSAVNQKAKFHRVTFHEITKSAITRAFEQPGDVDMNLVDAQQARRVLDRIVGYKISPLLRRRVTNAISAGRVQSVALRLVCEREREIQAFIPKEYWIFEGLFSPRASNPQKSFRAKLAKIDHKNAEIPNGTLAEQTMQQITGIQDWIIPNVETVPKQKHAPAPFITSTLQQAAGSAINFSASHTMRIAQQLYEGVELGQGPVGLITYMRTDSVAIAQEAVDACRDYILRSYGKDFVPDRPNIYKSKENAQGAHECIRPTDVNRTPESLKNSLDTDALKIYTLIWKRFVACQMASARQETVNVLVQNAQPAQHDFEFKASATATTFPGYLVMYHFNDTTHSNEQEEDVVDADFLKQLRAETLCNLIKCRNEQKFTEPPSRFTEATLIKELESNGIGRPSTYATIVNTIQDREYVSKIKGKLQPTETGFHVCDFLVEFLPNLFQVTFTADMENKLDKVEAGKVRWNDMMAEFYKQFIDWFNQAKLQGAPANQQTEAVLKLLSTVKNWIPPVTQKGKKRVFDEHKFYQSIADDFAKGNPISSKQWEVILGILLRHADEFPDLKELSERLGFSDILEKQQVAMDELNAKRIEWQKAKENAPEFKPDKTFDQIFAAGKSVAWKKPVKLRGRTYDDESFFTSLKTQYQHGKNLSEKQIAALAKIIAKYPDSFQNIELPQNMLPETTPVSLEQQEQSRSLLKLFEGFTAWDAPVISRGRTYDDKVFIESVTNQAKSGKILSPKQFARLKRTAKKYNLIDA